MPEPGGEVTRVEVGGRTLRLTSLDKILYPVTETTKAEVLGYYVGIAPVLLPHLAGRPVTRVRWPHGVAQNSFFEKNLPSGAPSWLPRVEIDEVTYPLVPDLATLSYLVNLNSLELHVPQWRVALDQVDAVGSPTAAGSPTRGRPDRLVIDLDPGAPAGLHECARVALVLRERLQSLGMELFPVTSGSKGIQLYAALGGDLSSDEVRDLVRHLAEETTRRYPDLVVRRMTRSLRPGKVLLDWSQNIAAKTTICPYSLRGRDLPQVAAPRTWTEIEEGAGRPQALRQLLFDEVLDRVAALGDPLAALG